MSTDTKLLAAQARIRVLREALQSFCTKPIDGWRVEQLSAVEALATPDDTAELDALIADAKRYRYGIVNEIILLNTQHSDISQRFRDEYASVAPRNAKEWCDEAIDAAMKEAAP